MKVTFDITFSCKLHWQVLSGSLCRVVCHREELCWRTSGLTSDTQLYHSWGICQCSEEAGYERRRSTPPSQTLDLWTIVLDLKINIKTKYLPKVFILPFGSLGWHLILSAMVMGRVFFFGKQWEYLWRQVSIMLLRNVHWVRVNWELRMSAPTPKSLDPAQSSHSQSERGNHLKN